MRLLRTVNTIIWKAKIVSWSPQSIVTEIISKSCKNLSKLLSSLQTSYQSRNVMTTRILYPTLILSQSKKYLEISLRMSMVRKREEAVGSCSICRAMSPRRSLVAKIRLASDRSNLRTPFRWLMQWPLELKLDRGNWIARITVGSRALTSCISMSFRRGRRWYSKM